MSREQNKKGNETKKEDYLIEKEIRNLLETHLYRIFEEIKEVEEERRRKEQELAENNVKIIRYCTDLPIRCNCQPQKGLGEWINPSNWEKIIVINGYQYSIYDVYYTIACLLPKDDNDLLVGRLYNISEVDKSAYPKIFEIIRTLCTDPKLLLGNAPIIYYKPQVIEGKISIPDVLETIKILYSIAEYVRISGKGRFLGIVYLPAGPSESIIEGVEKYLRRGIEEGVIEIVM